MRKNIFTVCPVPVFILAALDGVFTPDGATEEVQTGPDGLTRLAFIKKQPGQETTQVSFSVDRDAAPIHDNSVEAIGAINLGDGYQVIAAQNWRYDNEDLNMVANVTSAILPNPGSFLLSGILDPELSKRYFFTKPVDEAKDMYNVLDISTRVHGVEIVRIDESKVTTVAMKLDGFLYMVDRDIFVSYVDGRKTDFDWNKKVQIPSKAILVQAPNGFVGVIDDGTLYVYNESLQIVADYFIGKNCLMKVSIDAKGEIVPKRVSSLELIDGGQTRTRIEIPVVEAFANNIGMQMIFGAPSETAPMDAAAAK